jgi:hypothetical protein
MRSLALLLALVAAPALADGAVTVAQPDLSGIPETEVSALLDRIVTSIVIGQNCPDWMSTDGEWQLRNDSADVLTARLGLDPGQSDARFWSPAFAILDDPGACGKYGPLVEGVLAELQALGGGTTALDAAMPEPASTAPTKTTK